MAKNVIGAVAVFAGVKAIVKFGKESVAAAGTAELANVKLDTVMKNLKGTTDAQVESVKKQASALSAYTTIGGSAAKAGASQLAVFGLHADTINKLLPAMGDMAVGMNGINIGQDEMKKTALLMGKAMSGTTTALRRSGIFLTKTQEGILKTGTESQKAAILIDALKGKFGDLAKKMADTPEGRIIRLKNAWSKVKVEVGNALMPVVSGFLELIVNKLPVVQGALTSAISAIKPPLLWLSQTALPIVSRILERAGTIGKSAFDSIKNAIEANRPKFESIKAVFADIGLKLKSAFDNSQGSINWVKDVGLPGFVGILADVVQKVSDIYNYFNDNWSQIKPIVEGVTNAIIIYNGALLISTAWTKAVTIAMNIYTGAVNLWKAAQTGALGIELAWAIWRGKDIIQTGILIGMYAWDAIVKGAHTLATWGQIAATGVLTGAQWALNAAFIASPIGWIVLGIGALIGVFALLWQNNEGFRNFFIGMWEGIKSAVVSAGDIIKGVINGICSAINILISGYVGGINGLINGVNAVSGALGIPAIPNLPVPQIPMLASGGLIQRAGSVMVGERGAEILNLPRGASVTPLDKAGCTTENHINININGTNLSVDEIVGELVPRLKLALANM